MSVTRSPRAPCRPAPASTGERVLEISPMGVFPRLRATGLQSCSCFQRAVQVSMCARVEGGARCVRMVMNAPCTMAGGPDDDPGLLELADSLTAHEVDPRRHESDRASTLEAGVAHSGGQFELTHSPTLRHVRYVPRRKSERQRRASGSRICSRVEACFGASFVPPTPSRSCAVHAHAQTVPSGKSVDRRQAPSQKILEDANIKLTETITTLSDTAGAPCCRRSVPARPTRSGWPA